MTAKRPKLTRVAILGAGGHASVVIDALLARPDEFRIVAAFDNGRAKSGASVLGVPVLDEAEINSLMSEIDSMIVAIGDNATRQQLANRIPLSHVRLANALHPAAVISPHAQIGSGVAVMGGAVINAGAAIGNGVIVNTGATVDHDCVVGDFAHIGPGVSLGGGVHVGPGALVGIGASVLPSTEIGEWSVVGAGAVVIRAVSAKSRVAGVPAHEIPDEASRAV